MNPLNSKITFAAAQGAAAAQASMYFTYNDCPYETPVYALAWCHGLQQAYAARMPDQRVLANTLCDQGADGLVTNFLGMCQYHSPAARLSLQLMGQMMQAEQYRLQQARANG